MDTRYLHIAQRIETCMDAWDEVSAAEEANILRQIHTAPWAIDFDTAVDSYNKQYWTRNFWKAAYFFSYDYALSPATLLRLGKQQNLEATFIGGGAGADVLAYMLWFGSNFPLARLTITVIDRSKKQLERLAQFVAATEDLMDGADITMRYIIMDAEQWQPSHDSTDMLTLSHFLVENPENVHTLLQKCSHVVREGGDVVVIERPNDAVLHHAKQVLANAGLTVHDTTTNDGRMELIRKDIAKPGLTGISAHYLRATQPDKKRKAHIVSSYFQAWRQQIIEIIPEIFDETAGYDYRAGQPPVHGLTEMLAYWRDKPMRQSNINLLVRNATYTENIALCAFEGDFDTPTTHEIVKGAICFNFDNYTHKIKRLTGHYGVTKIARRV